MSGRKIFSAYEIESAIEDLINKLAEKGEIQTAALLGALRARTIAVEVQVEHFIRESLLKKIEEDSAKE